MKVIYVNEANLSELQVDAADVAMALGYFDGVHLGHQKVVNQAKEHAVAHGLSTAVLSFFPHPKSVLIPGFEVTYLEPIEQKMEKLEKLGVDLFYIVEFTLDLAKVSAPDFIEQYVVGLGAKQIVCGFDYTYGFKASGNANTLTENVPETVGVTVVEELKWQEHKISSTLIRSFIAESRIEDLPNLIGDFYKTKYCWKNGTLPYYALPATGHYKILLEQDGDISETVATVKCSKKIDFANSGCLDGRVLTIKWLEKLS